MQRRVAAVSTVVALVMAADIASKQWVLANLGESDRRHVVGPLDVVLRRNSGAAFSVAAGRSFFPWMITVLCMALMVWTIRSIRREDPRLRGAGLLAVALMIGGALGNQVDRWLRSPGFNRGSVVDFLDVGFWPVFNVADSALVIGAAIIGASAIFQRPESANT
jgi:signal peptidase II